MTNTSILAGFVTAVFATLLAPAQEPQPPAQVLPAHLLQALGDLRVPLHGGPADPQGGEYGLWAAGPGYKASFHDGFAFYPYRGPDKPLVRLHWQTESVTVGGTELPLVRSGTHTTDWRHELRYGPVTEVYDVLAEGVEQSFVLHRPVGAGDLVVTGRIGGDLSAAPAKAAPQALDFRDGHEVLVRYEEAVAFDAAGRRASVDTTFDGKHIRLTLGADFLREATFPVVVDPLTTPVSLNSSLQQAVGQSSVTVDNSSITGKAMVVFTRRFASGDDDAYGLLCNRDFSGTPATVWTEITTTWSSPAVDVAHVDGANRFAVAVQRDFSATNRQVRVYLHGQTSGTLNSGPTLFLDAPTGRRRMNPRIGGARGTGRHALVVCEEEPTSSSSGSPSTRITGLRVDALQNSVDPPSSPFLGGGPLQYFDLEMPDIVPSTVDQASWVAIWRSESLLGGGFTIDMARVGSNGIPYQYDQLFSTPDPVSELAVAGSWDVFTGRYAAAWVRASASGRTLEVRRFNQPLVGTPALRPVRTVASSSLSFFGNVGIDHDWLTLSHWALTYTRTTVAVGTTAGVVRLGSTGGITESQTLAPSSSSPSGLGVAYVEGLGKGSFLVTHGALAPLVRTLMGSELRYPLNAVTTIYGPICQLGTSITANLPFAGHEFFRVEVAPVGLLEFVYFIVGFAPTSVPLTQFGFPPTCFLSVDPAGALTSGFLNTDPSGRATLQLALPDSPLFLGDVFIQAAVFRGGGAPPFVTHGLGVQIR